MKNNHAQSSFVFSKLVKRYARKIIAREITLTARYFDSVAQWEPLSHDDGELFDFIEAKTKTSSATDEITKYQNTAFVLNGNLNHDTDILGTLRKLHSVMDRESRVIAILYNPYTKFIFTILSWLGIRRNPIPTTFLSRTILTELAKLSGFEICRLQLLLYCPFHLLGLGNLINSALRAIPLIRWLGFAAVVSLRPLKIEKKKPTLSVVVPLRNENGNVPNIVRGLHEISDIVTEVIFVEGHSTDGTWETIHDVIRGYNGPILFRAYKQSGKGKKDASHVGLSQSTSELVTILDADLTVPCKALRTFYDAYSEGHGDFINGSRLVYPLEDKSMRFLNWLGNVFFAKSLSAVLDTPLSDSLCGTKMLSRKKYQMVVEWCRDFGDFDPFGDFELLFSAASLGIGVIDVPIRYLARTYGETKISRFRHGFQLLRMTLIGLFTIKMGRFYRTRQRTPDQIIREKYSIQCFYAAAYRRFSDVLQNGIIDGKILELGSGGGFLKKVVPGVITSDVIKDPRHDLTVNASQLPFSSRELRAIFMLNVLHHLGDVETFFSEANRTLMPGGKLFIVDQYPGWIGSFCYRFLHNEPFNPDASTWNSRAENPMSGANGAIAWIVFCRDKEVFEQRYPNLKIIKIVRHTPFFYWLAGGLKDWTLLPGFIANFAEKVDQWLVRLFPESASFVDIEIEKVPSADILPKNAA